MKSIKNVLIVANQKKKDLESVVSITQKELESRNIAYSLISPSYFKLNNQELISDFDDQFRYKDYDLIIAIGGDGTFLYTARTFLPFSIPIIGINLGRVGFLMEINPADIGNAIEKIVSLESTLSKRMLLDVQVNRDGKDTYFFPFLNDAVISKGVLSRMVEFQLYLNTEPISLYRADGLIVSTPTGSTAYNLAAGGPILTPDIEAMVITPICPHTIGVRPIVTGKDTILKIKIIDGQLDTSLTIDGQENFFLKKNDLITISRSEMSVNIYTYNDLQFFSVLREKLGWHV